MVGRVEFESVTDGRELQLRLKCVNSAKVTVAGWYGARGG